jgi:hypothetical protein
VDIALRDKPALTPKRALALAIDFYTNFKIDGVDIDIPDYDMLLFQYGTYDWHDGKGEKFSVDFTRQFYIESDENEEFYQLRFALYFNKETFSDVKSLNKWSIDFTSRDEWSRYIRDTEGFKKAESLEPVFFDIRLGLT